MSNLSPVAQLYGKLSGPLSYSGLEEVVPHLYRQEFHTSGRVMDNDIVVLPISYKEEYNSAGGYTAIIAEEG